MSMPPESVAVADANEVPALGRLPARQGRSARMLAVVRGKLSYALGDQVVYSFGNMVVAALMSRYAGAREFGMYILTQRTLDVLIQLCNTLSWAPFTFNLPSTPAERQRSYRGSVFAQQIVACIACVVLLFAAAQWAATPARGLYYGTFHPLLLPSAVILFREFNRRMYFADMRMREAFWTETATVALQIAGVAWFRHTHQLDVPHTLLALAFGAGAVGLWWLLREWPALSVRVRDLRSDTALNFRLGRWFLGSNFVQLASAQANPWLLSAAFGGASVGAYTICESMVNIPRVALVSMQNVFAPVLSRAVVEGGKSLLRQRVARIDRYLLLGSLLSAVQIVVFGPAVARIIFHAEPQGTRLILFLLGLNFVAYAATLAQSYALSAVDRAGPTFYANVAGLAVQAASAWWLIRHAQVPGAAMALLLGNVVVVAVRQAFYQREMRRA